MKIDPKWMMLALLVVALGGLSPAQAQDNAALNLRPKFVEGQVTRYEVWTRHDESVNLVAGDRAIDASRVFVVEGEITWQVDKVHPDGSARCLMTLDWIKTTSTLKDDPQQVDDSRQAQGDNPALHNLLSAMAGAPVTVEVDADGTPRSVDGLSQIKRNLDNQNMMPDDRDFLESATDLATIAAVPESVSIGDTWNTVFEWSHQLGTLKQAMTYELKGVEMIADMPIATVVGEATSQLEPKDFDVPEGSPPLRVKLLDGHLSTQIMFDLTRGEAVGRNTLEERVIETSADVAGRSFRRTVTERVQGQALRIAEE